MVIGHPLFMGTRQHSSRLFRRRFSHNKSELFPLDLIKGEKTKGIFGVPFLAAWLCWWCHSLFKANMFRLDLRCNLSTLHPGFAFRCIRFPSEIVSGDRYLSVYGTSQNFPRLFRRRLSSKQVWKISIGFRERENETHPFETRVCFTSPLLANSPYFGFHLAHFTVESFPLVCLKFSGFRCF